MSSLAKKQPTSGRVAPELGFFRSGGGRKETVLEPLRCAQVRGLLDLGEDVQENLSRCSARTTQGP